MTWAIILAGGTGRRMGAGLNKVLLKVGGIPALIRSMRAFQPYAQGLVCVCREADEPIIGELTEAWGVSCLLAPAGADRQASVYNGLKALPDSAAYALVHDGARCLVTGPVIEGVIASMKARGSGVAAIPVKDTIKVADAAGAVQSTPDRSMLQAVQTPQGFALPLLRRAHEAALASGLRATDDAALVEALGEPVYLTPGSEGNFKLTTPQDLLLAEALLAGKAHPACLDSPAGLPHPEASMPFPHFSGGSRGPGAQPPASHPQAPFSDPFPSGGSRGPGAQPLVGSGYDVHRLAEGRDLILCGVKVPHERGLLGHSDADVALHALMDALLGAAGLYDIGRHFPDSDPAYQGISSLKLLAHVMRLLHERGFAPVNADITIAAQKPKLLPYMEAMRQNVAQALALPPARVNVKATTTERLGFEGRQEGISAQAVCLLVH